MKQFIKFLLISLAILLSKERFALNCTGQDGSLETTATISSSIAVPPTLPIGTVIWRSPTYTIDVKCWQEVHNDWGEYVYLYLNIKDPGQLQLGGQIELGLNYDGQDYLCSSPSMQSKGYCRMKLSTFIDACAPVWGCEDKAKPIQATFNFFIAKKKNGLPGQEGSLPNMPDPYLAVQFNGEKGVNTLPGNRNYSVYLRGLHNLRYVACSATVDITPRIIEFRPVSSFSTQQGTTIEERPIVITAVKTCGSVYGLGGSFIPVSGILADGNTTLVPANNSSVAIQLLNTDDRNPIVFNKEFLLAPVDSGSFNVKKDLTARLFWNANKAILGDFNASAKFEVYYK